MGLSLYFYFFDEINELFAATILIFVRGQVYIKSYLLLS
jgi:hypothetical protein